MLQVSVYDILQTRTYAHYRAQLSSLLAESGTTKGALERVLSEHPDLPLLSHMISCPRPRNSRNDLVKPGYRTQNMSNDAVDPWPAPSRVENEQSGSSQGHGTVPFPASDNRSITPSSREGCAAACTVPQRSRPADSRITKGSQDGPKGRIKVWKLRADSDEPASEAESDGGSDYAKQAWWVPKQVDRDERLTRACSTARTPGVPVPETLPLGRAAIPDSAETLSSYTGKSKDCVTYSPVLSAGATSPILGRGPQEKDKPLLKPRLQQPGMPIGTVSGGAPTRSRKTGSDNPLPRPGTLIFHKNNVEVAKAGGDSVSPTSRRTSTLTRSSESLEGTRGRGHWEPDSSPGGNSDPARRGPTLLHRFGDLRAEIHHAMPVNSVTGMPNGFAEPDKIRSRLSGSVGASVRARCSSPRGRDSEGKNALSAYQREDRSASTCLVCGTAGRT